MQFQALSQSYSGSVPRDQFFVQSLALTAADAADDGITAASAVTEGDVLENRRLGIEERRKSRSRRPSTLHNFIVGTDRLRPFTEIDDDEHDDQDLDNDDALDTESYISDRIHQNRHQQSTSSGPHLNILQQSQASLGVPGSPRQNRRLSRSSRQSVNSRLGVPVSEHTPLLSAGRRASIATLTPKPLQKVFQGSGGANKEAVILIWYTVPIFLTHLLEYSLLLATIISVGHLGTAELAASSLGSMTTNVCALSIIQGLCAALDTLCSQAYASANPKTTSLHALRTAYLAFLVCIPACVVIWHGEPLLLALGQDPIVAHLAGQYLRILIIGIPGYAGFEITRRWLQAQGLMAVPTASLLIASPINILLNWLLVWGPDKFRIGFLGAPLSTAISFNIMFLFSALYCIFFAPRDAWGGFTKDMFRELRPNIILGLAGFASVASEWWAWEIVGISSAYLGTDNLGANSVLGTSASLLYQLPYGLTVAAAVRVGNLVGARLPYAAKASAKMAWILSIVIGIFNSTLLLALKKNWGRLFSNDDRVVEIVASVIPLVGLFQLTDSITGAAMGVLRGTGLATLGAQINIVAYWVIGLPIGLLLTFSSLQWQLFGLWTGLTIALTFTCVAASVVIYNIDWVDMVRVAKKRTEESDSASHLSHSTLVINKDNPAQTM